MQRPTVLLGLSFALLLSGAVAAIADTPLAGNAYRWVLLLLVGTIVWAASPSRTVFGERTAAFDTACAIAILALFGPDVMRIADAPVLPALRYLSPIGLLGIIVCAAWRSMRPARADGALAALRIAPDARFSRAAVSAFLLLLFAAAVAGPALLLVAGLVPLPTVAVIVGVSDGIGDRVKVCSGVSIPPDGWKGVGVGEAFGSCVTRIKVGKTGGADAGEAQDARRARSNE